MDQNFLIFTQFFGNFGKKYMLATPACFARLALYKCDSKTAEVKFEFIIWVLPKTTSYCLVGGGWPYFYRPHTEYWGRYCFHRRVSFCPQGGCPGAWCVHMGVSGGCPGGFCIPPPRYAEIWSTGSRYASYWNAFLFIVCLYMQIIRGKKSPQLTCQGWLRWWTQTLTRMLRIHVQALSH